MELYLDQNLALLTQKGFKKPTNCVLSWLTSQGHRYSILIATPRNLGYIFAHNGLTEIGRGMRYLIYLKRQKISPLIWSGHILSNVSFFTSWVLFWQLSNWHVKHSLTGASHLIYSVKRFWACECMAQTLSTSWLYFKH